MSQRSEASIRGECPGAGNGTVGYRLPLPGVSPLAMLSALVGCPLLPRCRRPCSYLDGSDAMCSDAPMSLEIGFGSQSLAGREPKTPQHDFLRLREGVHREVMA